MAKRRQRGRKIDGIFLLDKNIGVSSNYALQGVKSIFYASKAGHTGSLDPLATGMLPICFGEATKFSAYLLEAEKKYQVEALLGEITESGDGEGKVIERHDASSITLEDIEKVAVGFRGEIQQVPPMYSALKHEGQALYKLARQGIEVERKSRKVTIHALEILELKDEVVKLTVHCSKGTYIRTLVEDIGRMLGCGAYVKSLRRTSVGPFDGPMMTLDELQELKDSVAKDTSFQKIDPLLLPVQAAISNWPEVRLGEVSVKYLQQGQQVMSPVGISLETAVPGWVSLIKEIEGKEREFIGVGEVDEEGRISPRRLLSTN